MILGTWLLVAGSQAWLTAYGHHHTTLRVALVVLASVITPALHFAATSRARRMQKRAEQLEIEIETSMVGRLDRRLATIAQDLIWLVGHPPDRARYEHWLDVTHGQIDRNSADAAYRWAQPDLGRRLAGSPVSGAELEARCERLLELYAEVAPPEKVRRLAAELSQARSPGFAERRPVVARLGKPRRPQGV